MPIVDLSFAERFACFGVPVSYLGDLLDWYLDLPRSAACYQVEYGVGWIFKECAFLGSQGFPRYPHKPEIVVLSDVLLKCRAASVALTPVELTMPVQLTMQTAVF